MAISLQAPDIRELKPRITVFGVGGAGGDGGDVAGDLVGGLGMVRDNLGNQKIAVDFLDHDFAKVAEGLGGKGLTVTGQAKPGKNG